MELAQSGYILTVDENGDAVEDNLAQADNTVPEVAAAPVDMRDFSRPTRPTKI